MRFLPKDDIKVIAGYGCPSVDSLVVNSGKRLRVHAGINEKDVCSSCSIRGNCGSAFVEARKDEAGQTEDVMRFLSTYVRIYLSGQSNLLFSNKLHVASIRRLLKVLVERGRRQQKSGEPCARKPVAPCLPYQEELGVPMKEGDWICSKCNFINFSRSVRCLRCGDLCLEKLKELHQEQVHLPLKKGDWICTTCNFFNFAKNCRCFICNEKPSMRLINPGEWECDLCNYINFRRNMKCLKCENARPVCSTSPTQRALRDGQPKNLCRGSVGAVKKQEIRDTEDGRFPDFPVSGGYSSLSQSTQEKEKWKVKMAVMMKKPSQAVGIDKEQRELEFQRRLNYVACSDDEDLAEWFGCARKK